jgi:hypothetical protein
MAGGFKSPLFILGISVVVVVPPPSPPVPTIWPVPKRYEAKLVVRDRDGTIKRNAITDFISISCQRRVNEAGLLSFQFLGDDAEVSIFDKYDQVEFWWRNAGLGIDWHREFIGLFMDETYQDDEDNITFWTGSAPGEMVLLELVDVAYAKGTANRSDFTGVPAETIAKTLVAYNATELATTGNDRLLDGDLDALMGFDIRIAPDQGRGNALDRSFAQAKLLNAISESVAPTAGGDFNLVRSEPDTEDLYWTFEFYPGQLGEDKSSGPKKVEFSKLRDNIKNTRWEIVRRKAPTVAVVGGRGSRSQKDYQVVFSPDYAPTDHVEIFVNTGEDNAALTSIGDNYLEENKERSIIDFEIIQKETVFYYDGPDDIPGRITYGLGDIGIVVYAEANERRKIVGVTITVQAPQGEEPDMQFAIETERVI